MARRRRLYAIDFGSPAPLRDNKHPVSAKVDGIGGCVLNFTHTRVEPPPTVPFKVRSWNQHRLR